MNPSVCTNDIAVFILNDDGKSLGLETVHRRAITKNFVNGNDLIAISNEVVKSPSSNPADVGLSAEDNAGDTSSAYEDTVSQSAEKRNSLTPSDVGGAQVNVRSVTHPVWPCVLVVSP